MAGKAAVLEERVAATEPEEDEEEQSSPAVELPGLMPITDRSIRANLNASPSEGAGSAREWLTEIQRTKAELDLQPKKTIFIPERDDNREYHTVQINDYTYQIQIGVMVEVPAEVARIVEEQLAVDRKAKRNPFRLKD